MMCFWSLRTVRMRCGTAHVRCGASKDCMQTMACGVMLINGTFAAVHTWLIKLTYWLTCVTGLPRCFV